MKKILGLLLVLTFSVFVVSCEKEKTGVGYGLVFDSTVGVATVKMKGKKVIDFQFEEYFLLGDASKVEKQADWTTKGEDGKDVVTVPDNVIESDAQYGNAKEYHAKYMLVDGKLYTGTPETKDNKVSVVYKNKDGKNIFDVVKVEADAKAYVEAAKNNKVFIVDNETATAPSTKLTVTGLVKTNFAKSKTDYWKVADANIQDGNKGWNKNIENLKEAFIKTGLDVTYTRGKDEKNWKSGDFTSSVSLDGFTAYQDVAKRAAANAK